MKPSSRAAVLLCAALLGLLASSVAANCPQMPSSGLSTYDKCLLCSSSSECGFDPSDQSCRPVGEGEGLVQGASACNQRFIKRLHKQCGGVLQAFNDYFENSPVSTATHIIREALLSSAMQAKIKQYWRKVSVMEIDGEEIVLQGAIDIFGKGHCGQITELVAEYLVETFGVEGSSWRSYQTEPVFLQFPSGSKRFSGELRKLSLGNGSHYTLRLLVTDSRRPNLAPEIIIIDPTYKQFVARVSILRFDIKNGVLEGANEGDVTYRDPAKDDYNKYLQDSLPAVYVGGRDAIAELYRAICAPTDCTFRNSYGSHCSTNVHLYGNPSRDILELGNEAYLRALSVGEVGFDPEPFIAPAHIPSASGASGASAASGPSEDWDMYADEEESESGPSAASGASGASDEEEQVEEEEQVDENAENQQEEVQDDMTGATGGAQDQDNNNNNQEDGEEDEDNQQDGAQPDNANAQQQQPENNGSDEGEEDEEENDQNQNNNNANGEEEPQQPAVRPNRNQKLRHHGSPK